MLVIDQSEGHFRNDVINGLTYLTGQNQTVKILEGEGALGWLLGHANCLWLFRIDG